MLTIIFKIQTRYLVIYIKDVLVFIIIFKQNKNKDQIKRIQYVNNNWLKLHLSVVLKITKNQFVTLDLKVSKANVFFINFQILNWPIMVKNSG